jgi:hypothetical protein
MAKEDRYYEKFVDKVYTILRNRGRDKYDLGYCIVQGKEDNTYHIQSLKLSTKEEKSDNLKMMELFINNLSEHLLNDKPFKILPKDLSYYLNTDFDYDDLFRSLNTSFFNSAKDQYSTKPILSSFNQFEKTLTCFAPILNSIENLLEEVRYNIDSLDGSFDKYFYTILSLNNNYKHLLESDDECMSSYLDDEMRSLDSNYMDCKSHYEEDYDDDGNLKPKKQVHSTLIKSGLINYLKKRQPYLLKITSEDENISFLNYIKSIFAHEDWKEMSSYIPNLLSQEKRQQNNDELILVNEKPIFQLSVNIPKIISISNSIINDKDLFNVTSSIALSLNDTKPEGVDYVEALEVKQGIILVMCGEKLNKDYVSKICVVFEKMISEYNSDNINKNLRQDEDGLEANKKYLDKAAEAYWLEAELDNSNKSSSKKVRKI